MVSNLENLQKKYKHHEKDSGSAEFQVINITYRINKLVDHFKTNESDFNSKRGLAKLVNRRKKYLDYIKIKNKELYQKLIEDLGLRK